MPPPSTVVIRKMALLRTKSRLTIPAPPPSPIPTATGSRSAANETFKTFLENSIHLPQLSLPESRFVSGANPAPAVLDFRSLVSPGGGDLAARMLRSVNEFGAFRIVNHGISGEEILSVVNEAKFVLEDCNKGVEDRSWVDHDANREAILQVRRRKDSEASGNTVLQSETNRQISKKMERIRSKLEGIAEKLSEILWECMGEKVKKGDKKETIFSIYKYNNQNIYEKKNNNKISKNEKEERESDDGNVMMSLHIPGEHCQFYVNSHQQHSFCFDAAADTIVVTIAKQLQELSLGKLKSARSEMIFVPDLLGSKTSFSIELKFSNPNLLNNHSHSKIISISDQIFIAFLLISLYFLYTYISSFFKGK
ncbi:unnamed protein product [Citrullus colocynthis]|uniref:Non-haem dioxygenase N-terminal domain-containing protein n=1 Tax=Citrullus colocynthis TaxID=252529 RepID=A0ABP0YL66_9ROSI